MKKSLPDATVENLLSKSITVVDQRMKPLGFITQ
jgi:hypothetical protein